MQKKHANGTYIVRVTVYMHLHVWYFVIHDQWLPGIYMYVQCTLSKFEQVDSKFVLDNTSGQIWQDE